MPGGGTSQAFMRRQYQISVRIDTTYYALFTDWKGERRKGLSLLEANSIKWEDFDADKIKPDKGIMELKREHLFKCRSPACR